MITVIYVQSSAVLLCECFHATCLGCSWLHDRLKHAVALGKVRLLGLDGRWGQYVPCGVGYVYNVPAHYPQGNKTGRHNDTTLPPRPH